MISQPTADKVRPETFDDMVGQEHLVGERGILRRMLASGQIRNMIFFGPPGTGKSQTITSLITQFVNEGKTVLMVSEKKTALDVVYSRLGTLSRYAMMMDDSNNKNLF